MLTLVEIAVAFVVIAFGAIALRFLPRDERGRRQLPRLVDESIGMYVIRGVLGRKGEAKVDVDPNDYEPTPAEIAYRIGIPGAPIPTAARRFHVSRRQAARPNESGSMPRPVPARAVASHWTGRPLPGGTPASALALQRRLAGAVAIVVVAIAVLGIGLALVSRGLEGGVLSATGTPAPLSSTDITGITGQPSAVPSPSFVSTLDTTERDGSSAGIVPAATAATAQPGNNAPPTPRRTPRPTPRVTPRPPTPTPVSAPAPTPTPTARTRPTRPPSPSVEPTPSSAPSQLSDPSPPAP